MLDVSTVTFGVLLRQLRRRAQMTQADLAAAVGYSVSFISSLEQNTRRPDVHSVLQHFVPALALQEEPHLATHLLELAAAAQGDLPPTGTLTLTHERRIVITATNPEPPTNLPTPPTPLIGRDETVKMLCDRLLGHQGRLLTLVGPPGVGKTRLALAVAASLQAFHADGVYFVPLAPVSDPDLVAAALVSALAIVDSPHKPPEKRLIEFLRRKDLLLLLDNFEQVSAAAPLVATLLAECPKVRILVTSRERLHLRAEQRYPVQPLEIAAACELFVQRAQAVDPAFVLTAENQPTIAAICQRLDCLPLALELSAVQVDLFSPEQLLTQLQEHGLELLVDGANDLPFRQQTLHAAIDSSYRLLNEAERKLFRSLALFVGGFDRAAAEMVSDWQPTTQTRSLIATLHALIHKSLVRSETLPSGEPRFLLLETIREYALEQVRAHGEEAGLRKRHYVAYLQRFRITHSHLSQPEAAAWLAHLGNEQDNLRAALAWSFAEARYADAAWLIVAVEWFWHMCGQWYEKGKWLAQLLPHRQALDVELRLAIWAVIYSAARAWNGFQPVSQYTNEVMQSLEICSNNLLKATVWFWLAVYSADFFEEEAAWEQSISLARAGMEERYLCTNLCLLADPNFVLVSSLWEYANALIKRGEIVRAMPLITESLSIFRTRNNPYEIADGSGILGLLALLQGNLVQASEHLHEAITIAIEHNLEGLLGIWQPLLGLVTLYNGNLSQAHHLFHESLRVCISLKDNDLLMQIYTYLAEAALCEDKLETAEQWLAQSLAYCSDSPRVSIYTVGQVWVTARLATARQQHQSAAMLFGLAEQMHSQIHYAISGPIRDLAEAELITVRAALDAAVFAEAFATGKQMSLSRIMLRDREISL